MASILEQIFAAKRAELSERLRQAPLEQVKDAAAHAPPPRDFITALRRREPAIIAEVKRASPSKGDIFPGLDPAAVAQDYAAAGAVALSVLTDYHFKGRLEDLRAVRAVVQLPILRKDFIFHQYQLYETRAAGADSILLIAAMLAPDDLSRLLMAAREIGLAALVEVHNQDELNRASRLGAELIGINNRDLHTFKTTLSTTTELLRSYSSSALIVSESGIETAEQVRELYADGARAFLMGESLLRGGAPHLALASLLKQFAEGAPALR
ncbi:MAG: indole-3-glycerol phosphate synthase TrpC [Bryobacterales bacterium]|nr:indole-3-glycerol phosphate synthase TrpC [Bryobacterales bacterium]